jgi:hypothetical protein
MTNPHDLILNTGKIGNDIDTASAGMILPVWVSRINPLGFDRCSASFMLSLILFPSPFTSYHGLKAEHLFKKRLPQDY